jgi:hypothetical protein
MSELDFSSDELKRLSESFAFYRYVDQEGHILAGQFFAVPHDQTPQASTNDTFNFEAVVKILHQPNSIVRKDVLNSEFINKAVQVAGKNAAAVVAKTHPNLIKFLLAL